ncbi:MAG: SGNH/GDSL hydrolase family protein [Acetobacteraceae bacterium]|nr:SGNH/GDSL hydrolase family protein [Acetobacteraceae bacterium]
MPSLRLLAAALLAAGLFGGSPAGATPCDTPGDLMTGAARPLPQAARALATGTLHILAIGSASVAGGGGTPEASWPQRMQAALAARYPNRQIEVTVRGGRGVTVAEHLALLQAPYPGVALVVWQAGTVEAARGLDPDEMSEALIAGLDRIRRSGADAVIVDQQFSRFLRANANIEPYREKLRMAAIAAGAPLFRRYELMQHWTETGAVDVERTPRAERQAAVDRLNDCIGQGLAQLIAQGMAEARRNGGTVPR